MSVAAAMAAQKKKSPSPISSESGGVVFVIKSFDPSKSKTFRFPKLLEIFARGRFASSVCRNVLLETSTVSYQNSCAESAVTFSNRRTECQAIRCLRRVGVHSLLPDGRICLFCFLIAVGFKVYLKIQ